MKDQQSGISGILGKIDEFTRKYYLNRIIRGAILSSAVILAIFLGINLLAYFFELPGLFKKTLFYGWLLSAAFLLFIGVISPLLSYFKLGRRISRDQAAGIIGDHFSDIRDKLLNLLQLNEQALSASDASLIEASIEQKISDIRLVPFKGAVDLSLNKQYLKYLLAPMLALLFIVIAAPNMIPEATYRLTTDEYDNRKAPFDFVLLNEQLEVMQFSDVEIRLRLEGKSLPTEAYLVVNGNARYKMNGTTEREFSYTLRKLQQDTRISFVASNYESRVYDLKVVPKPLVMDFRVSVDYPAYTGRTDEEFENVGDLTVPEGTQLRWEFEASNTQELLLVFPDTSLLADRTGENSWQYRKRAMLEGEYMVKVRNEQGVEGDSLLFSLQVVKDQFPGIQVVEFRDSVDRDFLYYLGEITDDYGFRKLTFNYQIRSGAKSELGPLKTLPVSITPGRKIQPFNYYWNTKELGLKPGDQLIYYFEVFDNDGIHGSKSSRSRNFNQRLETIAELEAKTEESNDEIKDKLEKSIDESREIQEEVKKLRERMLEKKDIGWEERKAMEKLLNKQQNLEEELNSLEEQFDKNLDQQSEFKDVSEELMEKQEKVRELFDELMSDEMKEMFKKLEEMMDEFNKENMLEQLEDMEMSDEQLENELDRMLELFKQLEMEQKMEEVTDKLDDLAEKQEELSEETKQDDGSKSEELQKKQEELNEEFEKVKEDMDQIQEMQKELGNEQDFSDLEKQEEEVDKNQEGAQQDMKSGDQKNASQKQKKAADQMKEMSKGMSGMMQSMQQEQMQEDMEALRQVLENLVVLSIEQEDLMEAFKRTSINTPKYVELVQDQFKIIDDTKIVEDSLMALAKRVFQMESFITDELAKIKKTTKKSVEELEERRVGNARVSQQYTMTSYNNLALMLSEVMEQMQQSMSSSMAGSQMCEKNQGSKGQSPFPSLKQMQQQLNDQMNQLGDMMKKKGEKPGEKPGEQGKGGQGGMSKEIAKMAAKQAAIRQALNEMGKKLGGKDPNQKGRLDELQKMMDQTEEDLVNKKLTNEMLKRQQEIMTRLLEAEKAAKEREFDEKRESKTANEIDRKIPPSLEEYLKERGKELERLKTVPPGLEPYYKNLVEQYFKGISF